MLDRITNITRVLEKSLDVTWLNNEVISNNIANVNTPGYKKSVVKFGDYLQEANNEFHIGSIEKDPKFLPIGKDRVRTIGDPEVVVDRSTSTRRDGNNVDSDVEMAELAKNTIKYNALINQISKQFSTIKNAINEGRR